MYVCMSLHIYIYTHICICVCVYGLRFRVNFPSLAIYLGLGDRNHSTGLPGSGQVYDYSAPGP